jgi:3-deoxy-D-manno-octulosonic-acid transferase
MIGWLCNLVYVVLLVLSSPLWLTRMIRHGRYRRDIGQRFGRVPIRYGLQPTIWVYGVSLGEVNAARPLVSAIHSQLPDYRVVVSSTTDTGMTAAAKSFAPDHMVFRWPADFTFAVKEALDRVRPALVILMEGDVWPNFTRICRRRGIPVVVVNGRIGPKKGYPRYKLVAPLAAWLFNSLTAIGVQHETYAEMFKSLGVRDDKLILTGMLKFDSADLSSTVKGQEALAAAIGLLPADRLITAGGTGVGEEAVILDAFKKLLTGNPPQKERLFLALVPRKPERFEEVARLIQQRGFVLVRRSHRLDGTQGKLPGRSVILGDTMGDLRKFYALSCSCFVGRSLVGEGGSDMIEAAALAKPVAFGPHTFNFPQADSMVEQAAAVRVHDAEELAPLWRKWLDDPAAAGELGRKAQEYVRSQQGSVQRNLEMICRILGRQPALSEGGIATDAIQETAHA